MSKETIGGYHEQLPSRHKFGDFYLDKFTTLELSGIQNLEHIRYLHARGDKLFMMGNHRSNADAPVLEHTLEKNKFFDLSSNLVFLLGQRLKASPGTNFFSMAYTHIDVWPTTMEVNTPEDKRKAFAMTKNSLLAVREQLSLGKIITVFPEGTRTRDGNIHEFNPQVMKYADEDEAYIIPFALAGTEEIWPVGQAMPNFSQNSARVNIGEPIHVRDHLERNDKDNYKWFMEQVQSDVVHLYSQLV